MEQKKALNRKKLKVILVICIVMIVTAGIGLAAYIHHVDTVTLGRKVSVYRLDVSKLTVEEAQQKISEAFQNKTITFHEDGKDVYNVSMEQLGYSLDQDILKSALHTSRALLQMLANMQEGMRGYFDELSSQRSFLGIQEVLVKEINNSDSQKYAILTTTDSFYRYKGSGQRADREESWGK